MDCLSVLKPLDELHLQFLHLRDLVHFDGAHLLLHVDLVLVVLAGLHYLPALLLSYFHLSESLGLQPDLVLHFVFLSHALIIHELLLLVLILNHLGLLRLLLLLQQ